MTTIKDGRLMARVHMDSLGDAADGITREFKWTLVSILAATSHHAFPIDGEGQIVVTITKERPATTGVVAAIDCKVAVTMGDTVPQKVVEAIGDLIDQGPPTEDLH